MFINVNKTEVVDNSIIRNKEVVKEYIHLRLKQEKEAKELRAKLNEELKACEYNLTENGVSKQRVNNARVIYEKTWHFSNPELTMDDHYEGMIKVIYSTFGPIDRLYFQELYAPHKEHIISYYKKHYDNQERFSNFRNSQKKVLKECRESVSDVGVDFNYVSLIYTEIKNDLKAYKYANAVGDTEFIDEISKAYSMIKVEILKELGNV